MSAEIKFPDRTDEMEEFMLGMPQVDCPVIHLFATDTYVRQITMPKGSTIIGHRHLTDHVNNIVRGKCIVSQDGTVEVMEGPHVFVSKPGVRKALHILEETVWQTIHIVELPVRPDTAEEIEEAVASIEPLVIEKSEAWLEHFKQNQIPENMQKLIDASNATEEGTG
jgi:quercetin dioxygenase-like cupin family protein